MISSPVRLGHFGVGLETNWSRFEDLKNHLIGYFLNKKIRLNGLIALILLSLLACSPEAGLAASSNLETDFPTPPASARPSCYWWWFNDLMDKKAITRNLEEFKAKGMGGVMLVCSSNGSYGGDPIPQGPEYLSPEWRDLYKFALQEAKRLGLEVGVNFCGGWDMGGPWITPENSAGGSFNRK